MPSDAGERRYPFAADGLDTNPIYAKLRREEPVSRVRLPYGGAGWLVTRYEDAKLVLADPRFSRAVTVGREDTPRATPQPPQSASLLSMDPPEHSRLRKLVAKAFSSRRVERLRPRVQQIVDRQLDEIVRCGPPADLVQGLASPLSLTVIFEILGVPPQGQRRFLELADSQMSTTAHTREQRDAARAELEEYLAESVAERREHPTDDLLGALVCARDDDDRLTEAEMVDLAILLLVAGYETTANQIANFTYTLLSDSKQWESLCARPELVPGAVEELLRYVQLASGALFPRAAVEDVTVGGVVVRAGETVFVDTQSAGRDEAVYEHPEELDLTREHHPHMAFGYGPHYCVGAQLALLELHVAMSSLLRRFPGLHLAVPPADIPWKPGLFFRGPQALPVSW
ncbi:cytochrome P450 [Nocardia sp. NPDC088792]|uniref:cytochrome P450 n=1 Tax=Nocardia sp. NPDC088792 TaxID=3364332 RepID=UPI003801A8E2